MNQSQHSDAKKSLTRPKGYPQRYYPATLRQVEWFEQKTRFINEDDKKLFAHILICTLIAIRKEDDASYHVPICQDFIDYYYPTAEWQRLVAVKLVGVKGHEWKGHKSKEFWVMPDVLDEFFSLIEQMPLEHWRRSARFNLVSRERSKVKSKTVINYENGHALPDTYRKAVRLIKRRLYNFAEAEKIIRWRYLIMKESKLASEQDPDNKEKKSAYETEERRFRNDFMCLCAVLSQSQPVEGMPGFYLYDPAYDYALSGRATEIFGCFQSCSRVMKAAIATGVEGFRNYDLKSSQVYILCRCLESAGIDATPFLDYMNDSKAKHNFAERVGVSAECWKDCFIAVIMGATVPKPDRVSSKASINNKPKNSVTRRLLKEFDYDVEKTKAAQARFVAVIQPFADRLKQWHDWLDNEYRFKAALTSKKGAYLVNRIGFKFYLDDLDERIGKRVGKRVITQFWKRPGQIAAFLLQGWEALYCHTMTTLSVKYGFRVVCNDSDGLGVLGEIPQAAKDEAAMLSGLPDAQFVEKDYLDNWTEKHQEIEDQLAQHEYMSLSEIRADWLKAKTK